VDLQATRLWCWCSLMMQHGSYKTYRKKPSSWPRWAQHFSSPLSFACPAVGPAHTAVCMGDGPSKSAQLVALTSLCRSRLTQTVVLHSMPSRHQLQNAQRLQLDHSTASTSTLSQLVVGTVYQTVAVGTCAAWYLLTSMVKCTHLCGTRYQRHHLATFNRKDQTVPAAMGWPASTRRSAHLPYYVCLHAGL
jgi:hypothetical protein